MELWLDTIDFDLISKSVKQLNVTGITTNPSILANGSLSARSTIQKLLDIQPGRVAVQVTANEYLAMIEQAQKLADIDTRIIIKIPVTDNGLLAINALSRYGIQTMATAIYEANQVLLSAMAGANYAAPYLGRIPGNSFLVLKDMLDVMALHKYPLKIIVAAIKSKAQIMQSAKLGAHAITIPGNVFHEFIGNLTETIQSINQFDQDWGSSGKSLDV